MTIRDALTFGTRMLRTHACVGSDADREPADLLAVATRASRDDLYSRMDDALDEHAASAYAQLIERRLAHAPMAYLIGTVPFFGREFHVTPDVLVPRPATETIVELATGSYKDAPSPLALDIGTGSGCIAVSLAGVRTDAQVVAIDASPYALAVAKKNAVIHDLADRITFHNGDLLLPAVSALRNARHATIVANLPYIPSASIDSLDADVRAFEPRTALDGGDDGLALYRRMLDQILAFSPALPIDLYVEMLPEQYDALHEEIVRRFPGAVPSHLRSGHDGVVIGLSAQIRP